MRLYWVGEDLAGDKGEHTEVFTCPKFSDIPYTAINVDCIKALSHEDAVENWKDEQRWNTMLEEDLEKSNRRAYKVDEELARLSKMHGSSTYNLVGDELDKLNRIAEAPKR